MSGSSLAPWALVRNPKKYTRQIARALNCSEVGLGDNLKICLRNKPLHLIKEAQVDVRIIQYILVR